MTVATMTLVILVPLVVVTIGLMSDRLRPPGGVRPVMVRIFFLMIGGLYLFLAAILWINNGFALTVLLAATAAVGWLIWAFFALPQHSSHD